MITKKINKKKFYPVSKPYIVKKDLYEVNKALKSGWVSSDGPNVKRFEDKFSKYIGRKHSIAVSNGTAALEIAVKALGLKKGDEVLIPNFTIISNALAVIKQNLKPILIDCTLEDWNIKIEDIEKKITKKTKAILVVDLYGYAVNIMPFKKLKKDIKIIHDCAQSLGAKILNRRSGMLADFACYSFHSQKNITTLGEGGAIYVKNNKLANAVKGLRHNGHRPYSASRKKYWKPAMVNTDLDIQNIWPHKFTLSEIQCAAGYMLMKRLDDLNLTKLYSD